MSCKQEEMSGSNNNKNIVTGRRKPFFVTQRCSEGLVNFYGFALTNERICETPMNKNDTQHGRVDGTKIYKM